MNAPGRNYTLKDEIRTYWSDRAPVFDHSTSHRIEDRYGMPEWHRLVRTAFDLGPRESLDRHRALDIACGTGEISRVLTSLHAEVTAVDFSETMLAIARIKLDGQNWQGVLADAEALHPLADDSFDVAVTRHLAWTLTDPAAAYAEWRRVLKPGGRLLIVDGNWAAQKGRWTRLRRWLADRIETAVAKSGEEARRHDEILRQLFYAEGLTATVLKDDLRGAGFQKFTDLSVNRLYGAGMRGASLAERLRQSGAHRFAFVAS